MDRSKSLIKNTMILGAGTIMSKCLVFIMIPFFSKWLTKEDYGTFDLYMTYTSLMIPLLTLACGEAVFRYMLDAKDDKQKKEIVSSGMSIVLLGSVLGSIAVGVIWKITGHQCMLAFLCVLVAEVINNYLNAYLRGIKRLDTYAISNAICVVLITIFVTVNVRFLDMGLSGILYGYAMAYFVNDIYMAVKGRVWQYSDFKKVSTKCIKDIILFSIPLIPNSIAWWIVNASDRIIITEQLGKGVNGVYAIANKMPQICTVLFSVFQVSWNQNASEAINDKDRDKYFSSVLNNMIKIVVSICICVIAVNFIVFEYIMDEKYYSAYYQVPILVAGTIFTVVSQYFGGIFIGLKRTGANGGTTMMAAVLNILINLIAIKHFGLYAASCSTLIAFISLCVIRWIYIRKEIKLKLNGQTGIYFLILTYFIVTSYLNNYMINRINVFVALAVFVGTNKKFIGKILRKVVKR